MRKSTFVTLLIAGMLLIPAAVYASHQFTDVPDSNQFHNSIDWMKDNNITVGCNPPANTRYCPSDNVTRGQMAAFMKRLAENNVVDAATLDGEDSTAYVSPIWGAALDWNNNGQGTINGTITAGTSVLSLSVSPPANGVLALNYNLGVFTADTAYYGAAWLQYDNGTCNWNNRVSGSSSYFDSEADANDNFNYVTSTIVKSTTTGSHTITLCAGLFSGGPVTRNDANITATFSGTGLATAGVPEENSGGSADPQG
jgi:hypothetical protein